MVDTRQVQIDALALHHFFSLKHKVNVIMFDEEKGKVNHGLLLM
jgi:hypothetical protein